MVPIDPRYLNFNQIILFEYGNSSAKSHETKRLCLKLIEILINFPISILRKEEVITTLKHLYSCQVKDTSFVDNSDSIFCFVLYYESKLRTVIMGFSEYIILPYDIFFYIVMLRLHLIDTASYAMLYPFA